MDCTNCGKKIPFTSEFCRFCGQKIIKQEERNRYAGFWLRLGAYVIDLLAISIAAFVVGVFLEATQTLSSLFYELPDSVLGYIFYVVYSTVSLGVWSTTLGKYLYGLVVKTQSNKKLDANQSLKRSLLQPFSTLLFGIGYWKMNKNSKKQAWHDRNSETVVVKKRKPSIIAYLTTVIGVFLLSLLYLLNLNS